ncbi:conserved virulence factor C family protein [Aquibacillus sp. 3ASR75-11]|uniref:Conserved virulence factor C family protein n=1 Tax=Terrihalobacillus insolitus TaxID=2950438 RepID=A0A9X3WRK6_9BACI|nr:conserved virulence factor C family protein [Terrihalobacillus insolitus]MDC3412316.1 conserved virulence factor C family protein [Terrihalobacillus insolitus]MDC3422991.1 conserved virulence factor C family protein [Terrihalobacillus insolitus]
MKLLSIEPTPSPNSMKLNLNKSLPDGQNHNYKQGDQLDTAPDFIQRLFEIDGVKGIYHVADFIALERNARIAWETILPQARRVFGEDEILTDPSTSATPTDHFGEVKVFIQMFRDIPMQVKLEDGAAEQRFGLPEMFMDAALKASEASPNFVMERKWVEQKPRYGSVEDIGKDVVEEIGASYDEKRLDQLVNLALEDKSEKEKPSPRGGQLTLELDNPDWKKRYAGLDQMGEPTFEDLPILQKALDDEKASIRRLATAYLGMIEEPEVLPLLYKALKDKAVNVRRTAGDCLSDLGFKQAIPEMTYSLSDPNKLVRWRAAMFLYEIGDETALPALHKAADDPEFEVQMQVKMAIERIEGGEAAKGSVWHQMTQATQQKKEEN